ncbi:DUF1499 domain-containing protein [Nitratireductor sp. L1-7-SE]|uniref:DUF1499 domain-containing protein n=1 Tax=Nitratireductor rhodophyticola TaxID=2854036 RepID=A0ABS7RCI1_9HYPH|nr:DUF1499 domain-containing protein [Nitratireductor rhodophyticola]MBY8918142.1 DUF1499 domain-containing protein [Nitratireductor rhodophyticola]MBY8921049.1 DUF1499 domain-containing protein [Nitratireductor rhodophyticola]MEC9247132.1 DUF1499 domain-containing protein [Pseudomonadota bacterium]
MKATLVPQRAPAAPWSLRLAVFAAVLLAVSGAGHRFGLVETVPFFWLLGLSGILALTGFALGVIALVQVWEHGSSGASIAGTGILIAAIVLTPYGISGVRVFEHPRLIDISTDLDRPPQMPLAAAARTGAMNPVKDISPEDRALQEEGYPEVAGRRYEHTADKVLEVVRSMMQDKGWQPRGPEGEQLAGGSITLEGVAHSFILGFPADVAIRIEDDQTATFVDMRSVSRYARHDLGDNAARIQRFLKELDERMALLAAV